MPGGRSWLNLSINFGCPSSTFDTLPSILCTSILKTKTNTRKLNGASAVTMSIIVAVINQGSTFAHEDGANVNYNVINQAIL